MLNYCLIYSRRVLKSGLYNRQLGAPFLQSICARMREFLLICSFGRGNPSARIEERLKWISHGSILILCPLMDEEFKLLS